MAIQGARHDPNKPRLVAGKGSDLAGDARATGWQTQHDTSCQTYQQKALLIHGRNEQGANSQAANGRSRVIPAAPTNATS